MMHTATHHTGEIFRAHIAALRGQLPGFAGEARWLALDPGVNHQRRNI